MSIRRVWSTIFTNSEVEVLYYEFRRAVAANYMTFHVYFMLPLVLSRRYSMLLLRCPPQFHRADLSRYSPSRFQSPLSFIQFHVIPWKPTKIISLNFRWRFFMEFRVSRTKIWKLHGDGQEGRTTSSRQILLKSAKTRPRYCDLSIFQDGGRRHLGF